MNKYVWFLGAVFVGTLVGVYIAANTSSSAN